LKSNGFVLIDSLYRPVYADPESIQILTFPNVVTDPETLDVILTRKILAFLPRDVELLQGTCLAQFESGKRHYSCRAFLLEDHWSAGSRDAAIALLFERGLAAPPASSTNYGRVAGAHEDPFAFSPDPRYFAFSRAHREVFASLRNLMCEGRGIGVLLSQAGMGKTLLLDYLAQHLRRESEIAFFPGSFDSRAELVRAVMATLGVDRLERDLSANLGYFEEWLVAKNLSGRRVTLLCDDAQDFSFDTLENLCLFSDLKMGSQKLLQVILAGRQGLLEKLNDPRMAGINGRINIFCTLSPLDHAEVRNYVVHRLRVAGCTRELFSPAALSSIALYSRGIPLNINMICRHSLSLAAAINLQTIDDRVVADSAYDLVLRAQPVDTFEDPNGPFPETHRRGGLLRNRRGLRLVEKS
jgi:type II secretory pathway predicted ATPase ExeA